MASGTVDLKEFVTGFVVEAEEYLDSVNKNLVAASEALKSGRAEPRAVRELFRSLHTIKGLASMVGAEPIVAVSHEMEGILRSAERGGGLLSDQTLGLLLQGTRAIEERVQAISKLGVNGIPAVPKSLIEALAFAQSPGARKTVAVEFELVLPPEILKVLSASDREQVIQGLSTGRRAVMIDFDPSPARNAAGFNITTVRDRLGKLGELVKVVPRSSSGAPTGIVFSLLLVTSASNPALSAATGLSESAIHDVAMNQISIPVEEIGVSLSSDEPAMEWTPSDHSSIRVDVRRLDEVLERLSDLVVTRSKLALAAVDLTDRGIDTRELNSVLAENTRQLKRLRAAVTKARMVPLAELLQRLPLVVRGLTQASEKTVNLVMQLGSSEVDKAVADKIFPAIVHLVRNAIDHAFETRTERRSAGKPEAGTLTLICDDSSGTSIVLTLRDDGRGIDRNRVASKLGVAKAGTDEELLKQIASPGMSTRDSVSTTSGRGMGMDIVKRSVEVLGGQLQMSTADGVGTTFTLHIPVNITIVDVLSFVCGDQIFAVPVAMVVEILELDQLRQVKAPSPSDKGVEAHLVQRRGEAIPLLSLGALLKHKDQKSPRMALVVNQHGGGAVAFGVDRMMGQQEVVVRPLDDVLVRVAGMSGATDLGDGRPTLVLDLATMGAVIH